MVNRFNSLDCEYNPCKFDVINGGRNVNAGCGCSIDGWNIGRNVDDTSEDGTNGVCTIDVVIGRLSVEIVEVGTSSRAFGSKGFEKGSAIHKKTKTFL